METSAESETDILIVGGGLCGLATAVAFHRKGIRSVVVERSVEEGIARGSAISIFSNGWRALHQLGLASKLRPTAIPIQSLHEISLDDHNPFQQRIPLVDTELRCLKRGVLIEALTAELPAGTLHFGRQVTAVKLDPITSYPTVQFHNGGVIRAKLVIGCDGVNSVVAQYLGLQPPKLSSMCSIIGFTNHPDGHNLDSESIRMTRGGVSVGRFPMDDKLVYWFVSRKWTPQDVSKDAEIIRKSAVESIMDFPDEIISLVRESDLSSITLTRLRYRAPWELLCGRFRKGRVVVAGDAMHVMPPFLGQGGSAALEDAVVLARCVAQNFSTSMINKRVEAALDQYVKERRMRLLWLSAQTYLIGLLSEHSSQLVRLVCLYVLIALFRDTLYHARYNCGQL